jgi:hypothetical protein
MSDWCRYYANNGSCKASGEDCSGESKCPYLGDRSMTEEQKKVLDTWDGEQDTFPEEAYDKVSPKVNNE